METGQGDEEPNVVSKGFRQEGAGVAPLREIKRKAGEMSRWKGGEWEDLHARYIDLWQEGRMVIWRAKRSKPGPRRWDEERKEVVESFIADEKVVLEGLVVLRGVLDSMVRIRREMGREEGGIPRWAVDRIEQALRKYPEAMQELLKELARGEEKGVEKIQ